MKWFATLSLVIALATGAFADEILLNDGSAVEGKIQTIDHTGITAETDGKTVQFEPAQLDTHYFYNAWSRKAPKEAEAHLRLAVYAYENGLFNQARSQYRKAQQLDKEMVKKFEEEIIPQIKEGIAENLLALTRSAVEKKDWTQAKRLAGKILTELEDTKAAGEAREILASAHMWQLDADQQRLVRSLAKYLPKDEEKALKTQERVTKKLQPLESRLRKAQDLVAKGLHTKSSNRQKGIFQTAAKRMESIVKDLDKLAKTAGEDQALQAYIAEGRAICVREAIDAYVHAGGVYLIRRDYQNAIRMANAALALDPESAPAKQFYERTLKGSQMRSGWWGRGR